MMMKKSAGGHYMKRTLYALVALILTLILTACGEQPERINERYTLVETDFGVQRIFPPNALGVEYFLEDIDYMMYILENNFALLEVAYWARNVDARALADNARADVIAAYEYGDLCEDRFLAILWTNFFPLFNTGHFTIFNPIAYHNMINNFHIWGFERYPALEINYRLLHTPLALRFYESRVHDRLQDVDAYRSIVHEVVEGMEDTYNRFIPGRLHTFMDCEQVPRENIIAKSIEEGQIGYLSVNSFAPTGAELSAEETKIFNFFREIRDYGHLILDFRGNTGGTPYYFLNIIMRPNIASMVEVNSFHFFMDGSYIRRYGDYKFSNTIANGNLRIATDYRPISEVLAEHDFTELHLPDFNRLHYGTTSSTGRIQPLTSHFGGEVAFLGKIWMLTDNGMGSAAQLAAWISMESNFATHVGETTGGNFGGLRAIALLPHTGIAIHFDMFYVTDSRGRPLEAGTIPHYFNRPGMDALETTLALIAEGEY